MREILFRAKIKNCEEFFYGHYYKTFNRHYITHETGIVPKFLQAHYEIDVKTLGEYAGIILFDTKPKTSLFEGDIVAFFYKEPSSGEKKRVVGVIEFKTGGFSIRSKGNTYRLDVGGLEELEVIGNIHDDSELLEDV